jgi:hypothetical protein
MRKNEKEYPALKEVKTLPATKAGRKPASELARTPRVAGKKGWVLISEPLPRRHGQVERLGSIYDEVAKSFSTGRKKSARVLVEGRTVKAMSIGLRDAIKRHSLEGLNVHTRKVDGEERVYITKG